MRKIFTATAISMALATSAPVFAHSNFSDSCNINFEGELQFKEDILSITLKNGDIANFTADGEVSINGEYLSLDSAQSNAAQQYYSAITESIPQTAEIAIDALEVASVAVTEAFGELLGYDDPLVVDFEDFFATLHVKVNDQFYAADGSFHMKSSDSEDGSWVNPTWESELEEQIEDMVERSIGRILVAVGTEMVMSGGDMSAFESRMENFGERIEQRVEFNTEELEHKADQLCMTLSTADVAESKLASSVDALSTLDMLDIENPRFKM
ncbi:DUF2884 family protein [Alteromonas facilis]|uniref:DUF2884 family protein n=1 Tax=Alteromonas facilis TaxID=2048004 RepID=UPI0013DBE3DF|nr:DUF2884 family protein [Alteromonas facilis]